MKIIFIIAFRGFQDEEYFITKEILEKASCEVKTASIKKGTAIGANGGEAKVDFLVSEVNPADFDAVVFIGGSGCLKDLDNEESYELIRKTIAKDKILASICISPLILAKAGVLKGKTATVWSDIMDKSAIKTLKDNGADYQEKPVVIDGKIITAWGPDAAEEFGEEITKMLKMG